MLQGNEESRDYGCLSPASLGPQSPFRTVLPAFISEAGIFSEVHSSFRHHQMAVERAEPPRPGTPLTPFGPKVCFPPFSALWASSPTSEAFGNRTLWLGSEGGSLKDIRTGLWELFSP